MTSKDIRSTISSPASAAGAERYDSRIGPIIEKFGLEAVLASLSPSRAKEVGLLTTVTSGRISDISSRSAALQSCLESRLRQRLNGSDLCEVIWKPWTTPWGQCLSRPRARVRTTCEIGSGLWATIRATDGATDGAKGGPNMSFGAGGQPLPAMAAWGTPHSSSTGAGSQGRSGGMNIQTMVAGVWQTPVADDAPDREKGKINSRGEAKLSAQAIQAAIRERKMVPTRRGDKLRPETSNEYWARMEIEDPTPRATWPTTTTRDHKDGHYQPNVPINCLLGRMVWPTPTSLAKSTDTNNEAGNSAGLVAIRKHAIAATYPTPSASGFEARDPQRLLERRAECKERTNNGNGFGLTLGQFATLENTSGSSAPTEKRGALNPEFVCWLMGYPTEWVNCAGSETRSTRGRQRPSSKA